MEEVEEEGTSQTDLPPVPVDVDEPYLVYEQQVTPPEESDLDENEERPFVIDNELPQLEAVASPAPIDSCPDFFRDQPDYMVRLFFIALYVSFYF